MLETADTYEEKIAALKISIPPSDRLELANATDLKSNSDIILVTYGVGDGGKKQETPNYLLELAQKYPEKDIQALHFDHYFNQLVHYGDVSSLANKAHPKKTPHCLYSDDWQLILPINNSDRYSFRHKTYTNLKVTLINRSMPEATDSEEITSVLSGFLERGATVFLGVHNQCFYARSFERPYNTLVKKFPNLIRLYIQCADLKTYIYNKEYNDAMGKFMCYVAGNFRLSTQLFIEKFLNNAENSEADVQIMNTLLIGFEKNSRLLIKEKINKAQLDSFLKPNHGVKLISIEQLNCSYFPMLALLKWDNPEGAVSQAKKLTPEDSSIAEKEMKLNESKVVAPPLIVTPQTFFGSLAPDSQSTGSKKAQESSFQFEVH